jgi:S1-C subfamily serine protease
MGLSSTGLKAALAIGSISVAAGLFFWNASSAQQSATTVPTAAPSISSQPPSSQNPSQNLPKQRLAHLRAITVRLLSGKQSIGSGTIIAIEGGVYRVITNQHVLPTKIKSLSVQTADQQIHVARLVKTTQSDRDGLDLALLEFDANDNIYVVAKQAKTMPTIGEEIITAGFPADRQPSVDQNAEEPAIASGTVSYLPNKPLADGYQIGHRANIQKGMSGGPAINMRGELTGINGVHAQPLWEAVETYADGTAVEEPLQSEIAAVSWAIPVQRLPELGIKP